MALFFRPAGVHCVIDPRCIVKIRARCLVRFAILGVRRPSFSVRFDSLRSTNPALLDFQVTIAGFIPNRVGRL